MWKAAAKRGHGEASLRVGDFYYYHRFREPTTGTTTTTTYGGRSIPIVMGPFGWVHYLIFPEHGIPILYHYFVNAVQWLYHKVTTTTDQQKEQQQQEENNNEQVCLADENNQQQCLTSSDSKTKENDPQSTGVAIDASLESDLEMAAYYYRMATETEGKARAHFNLGFLYEWGLGLKQDFPLAKRHYDLAVSSSSSATGGHGEAELPVAIALWGMHIHEKCLKWYQAALVWLDQQQEQQQQQQPSPPESGPDESSPNIGTRDPDSTSGRHRRAKGGEIVRELQTIWNDPVKYEQMKNVFASHLCSWESVAILLLTLVLMYLFRLRDEQQHDRRNRRP